jgi:hypothetical protein
MSPNRILSGLSTLAVVILTGFAALGEDHELQGLQLFEPADVRPYGNWAKPNEGFFLTFDGIFWTISAPKKTSIGDPNRTPTVYNGPVEGTTDTYLDSESYDETNSLDTGRYRAKWKQGDRIEFGYVDGHSGWLVSTIETNRQTQHLAGDDVSVVFNDPPFDARGQGYLTVDGLLKNTNDNTTTRQMLEMPVIFDHVSAINRTSFNGAEAMYLYRTHQLHRGSVVEFMVGGRYLQFNDTFDVTATGGNLADSYWNTYAKNQIAGPEVGYRWWQPFGRFALSTEGRFMAGINAEKITQDGQLASTLSGMNDPPEPRLAHRNGFQSTATFTEFTPLVEFRAEAHAKLTNLISFKAGYTITWMDNIARASDMVDYTVLNMGITSANGGQKTDVLIQGLNIGVELNR